MVRNAINQSDCGILWSSISLERINQYLRFFAWRYSREEKVASATMFFDWVQPVVSFVQSNDRILWSSISLERIGILDFLHGDNYQGAVTLENTTFGWVWLIVPLVQSSWSILLLACLRNKSILCLKFSTGK